jgi:hypothetical protein
VWTLAGLLLSARAEVADSITGCMAVSSAIATSGQENVVVDISGAAPFPIRGFSLALGHDDSRLELVSIEPGRLFAAAELISTSITNQSEADNPPHATLFVVLDFNAPLDQIPLEVPPGTVLGRATYRVRPAAPAGTAAVRLGHREYGRPRVSIIYVTAENQEVRPALEHGFVTVTRPVEIASIEPDHGALAGGTRVTIRGQGFDPTARVFLGGVEAAVLAVPGPAELLAVTPPAGAPGKVPLLVAAGAGSAEVADAFEYRLPPEVLTVEPPAGSGRERIRVRGRGFTTDLRAFVGSLELVDVLVLDPTIIEGGLGSCELQASPGPQDVRVEEIDGAGVLRAAYRCEGRFVRGECNGDGAVDISDAIFGLAFLFSGGPGPRCDDGCDANDDGAVDISDAIWLLGFLFLGGPRPPEPFPSAGGDPTNDRLDCAVQADR